MRRWSRGLGMLPRLEPGPSLGGGLSSAAEPGSGSQEIFDSNAVVAPHDACHAPIRKSARCAPRTFCVWHTQDATLAFAIDRERDSARETWARRRTAPGIAFAC
jgi:hypothetical protein